MNQKDIDLLVEMLKDLKTKNAELSQNLASLQKDYHELVKSLASTQSNNTTTPQSQASESTQNAQSQTNATAPKSLSETKITKFSDFPQPRVSRVKEILAGGVSKAQEPAQQGESKESNTQTLKVFDYQGKVLDYGMLNDEPVFSLNAIAESLSIENPRTSIDTSDKDYCMKLDNSVVGFAYNRNLNNRGELFLTEAGLYRLLMRSNKPEVQNFQKWVTKEVLPSIRKTGAYQIDNQDTLKRYEALFGGKFSVQTPCKQFIMQNIAQAEAKHNAIATELVSYNYTEEFKKGKAKISSKIGLVYDRPVAIDKKPIITKGYLPNEMLRENQNKEIEALNQRKRKCQ